MSVTQTAIYGRVMSLQGVISVTFLVLLMLCVLLLLSTEAHRLRRKQPLQKAYLLALFGTDVFLCSLLDVFFESGAGEQNVQITAGIQFLFLWMPLLLAVYYRYATEGEAANRMRLVLVFDLVFSVYLLFLFFIFSRERVVIEFYTLFMLTVTVLTAAVTLLTVKDRGDDGCTRPARLLETGALLFLCVTCMVRFAGMQLDQEGLPLYVLFSVLGAVVYLLVMAFLQVRRLLPAWRTQAVGGADHDGKAAGAQTEIAGKKGGNGEIADTDAVETGTGEADTKEAGTVEADTREAGTEEPVSADTEKERDHTERKDRAADHYEEPDAGEKDKGETDNKETELPVIEGIDWNYALMHLPDEELLAEMVRDFYALLTVQADKLDAFYMDLSGTDVFASYRIQVHGMKSSAATIGIIPLAGMAAVLEAAAREEKEADIRALHPVFIDVWRSYREKLTGVFGIGAEEVSDKKQADPEMIRELLTMLKSLMEELDVDAADGTIAQLKQFSYDEAGNGYLEKLTAAVADLDSEETALVADEWIVHTGG